MNRKVVSSLLPLLSLFLVLVASCRSMPPMRDTPEAWPDLTPTQVEYVDGDGFDALLENALVNQDPVIVVRTGRDRPDWGPRLNAWIAAWNLNGGSSRKQPRRASAGPDLEPKVRGQAALGRAPIDGESIRELRLLVNGLLDRAEDLATSGASWWVEERARSRRIALLKPYSLRFHMDDEEIIQLVLFHGSYSSYYPRYVQQLTRGSKGGEEKWTRAVECSHCRGSRRRDLLTSSDPEVE